MFGEGVLYIDVAPGPGKDAILEMARRVLRLFQDHGNLLPNPLCIMVPASPLIDY